MFNASILQFKHTYVLNMTKYFQGGSVHLHCPNFFIITISNIFIIVFMNRSRPLCTLQIAADF